MSLLNLRFLSDIKKNLHTGPRGMFFYSLIFEDFFQFLFYPTDEDSIVQNALGIVLNTELVVLLKGHSYGNLFQKKKFYDLVCTIDNVTHLYKLNLTNDFFNIDRELLLSKLEHIVSDNEIIKYVRQFLYLPIQKDGLELRPVTDRFRAPVGFLSYVLLNYCLMDLDQEFHRLFPHLNNFRYMQNVLVPFTSSEELTSQKILRHTYIFVLCMERLSHAILNEVLNVRWEALSGFIRWQHKYFNVILPCLYILSICSFLTN